MFVNRQIRIVRGLLKGETNPRAALCVFTCLLLLMGTCYFEFPGVVTPSLTWSVYVFCSCCPSPSSSYVSPTRTCRSRRKSWRSSSSTRSRWRACRRTGCPLEESSGSTRSAAAVAVAPAASSQTPTSGSSGSRRSRWTARTRRWAVRASSQCRAPISTRSKGDWW